MAVPVRSGTREREAGLGGFQNMAAPIAEGALKSQSDLAFDLVTTIVRAPAHWFLASRQALSDIPQLQSYIDGRARYGLQYVEEAQLLAGDGTGQNLLGLIPQAPSGGRRLSFRACVRRPCRGTGDRESPDDAALETRQAKPLSTSPL